MDAKGRFTKGDPRAGRPKGIVSKSTAQAREAIARLVDANSMRLQEWLDQIAEEDGALAAWRCMMDVIEYHIPKLARTELTGADGAPLTIQIVDPTRRADPVAE